MPRATVLTRAVPCIGTFLAVALLTIACAPTRTEALPRGLWDVAASGTHVRYHVLAGAEYGDAPEAAVARLERFLDSVGPAWRVPERIDYYAFPDRETLRELTSWSATGRALLDHDAVVSVYAADAHEVAHLLTAPPERPLRLARFWLEGIAMYYTWPEVYFGEEELRGRDLPRTIGVWSGRSVHAWAQEALSRDELPALAPLVHGNRPFDAIDDAVSYPAAGSFTTFLLGDAHRDLERLAAFRAFLADANVTIDAAGVARAFDARLGLPLDEAERAWHAFLERWDETSLGGPR